MAYFGLPGDDLTTEGIGVSFGLSVTVGSPESFRGEGRKPMEFLICDLRFLSKEQNKVL
jgi:hypothetical protein